MSFKARCLPDGDVAPFAWQALAGIPEARPAVRQAEHDLEERAATIERDAFAKGYAEGERAGTQAAATRTDAMLRRLARETRPPATSPTASPLKWIIVRCARRCSTRAGGS